MSAPRGAVPGVLPPRTSVGSGHPDPHSGNVHHPRRYDGFRERAQILLDPREWIERVELIFRTMQTAWSSLDWERARPYLSDNLFQTNAYWIAAYRAQGPRNVTEDARIVRSELVRLEADRWFDAVTVRLHATGQDYTVRDADGAVVGGHRDRERPYSEYWTLVRGASRHGPARTEPVCPSCGAPMSVSMAALCAHCGVKVSSGEFDWVLSRIEQAEAYGG